MSAERVPALRVRLPCADESDFYARLADGIAANGLRIPTANPRPIGARVKVTLEFRNGGALRGEALVDARLEGGPRPVLNVRFVRFEGAEPAAAQAPAPAPPPAPAGKGRASTASTAGAGASATLRAVADATPATSAGAARAPWSTAAAARATASASLFEDVPDADPGDLEDLEVADATADVAAPAAAADAAPVAPSTAQARARRGRVARGLAIVAAVAVAIGWIGWSALSRRPLAPPPATPERSAADAHIAAADRRLSEARLIGPDGALEHLVEARRLVPTHGGAARRLALLADTLEALGARALERGDIDEASVQLLAARDAAPERESIRTKLATVAGTVRNGAGAHKRATGAVERDR